MGSAEEDRCTAGVVGLWSSGKSTDQLNFPVPRRDTMSQQLRVRRAFSTLTDQQIIALTAMTRNRLPSPLPKPSITLIDNGHSTQLIVRVRAVPSAKSYEVRCAAIGAGGVQGAWQPGGIFTSSRSMPVNGLVPGTSYTFQVRAVGGSTGFSDWSDPLSHMCM